MKYITPEIEVIELESVDVIRTSSEEEKEEGAEEQKKAPSTGDNVLQWS